MPLIEEETLIDGRKQTYTYDSYGNVTRKRLTTNEGVLLEEEISISLLAYTAVYDAIVDIYETIIETSIVEVIVPEAAKSFVSEMTAEGLVAEILNVFEIEALENQLIIDDLHTIAEILRKVEELGIIRTVINGDDLYLINDFAGLVDLVFSLNILDHRFVEIIAVVVEELLAIDLSNTNINAISHLDLLKHW